MRVLVVEDDVRIRHQIRDHLRGKGYAVDEASDGEEGLYMIQEMPIDLAIVDIGLPEMSGTDLIASARGSGCAVPVIILTARGRWQDKVNGLESGADDYLVKPFQIEELMARMHALLRRSSGWANAMLECGGLKLDPNAQKAWQADEALDLTGHEYKLLEYLMLHAGKTLSKRDLLEHIYEEDVDRDGNVIEVFVRRLRQKLDPSGSLRPIETVRGRGYRLALARTDGGQGQA